MKANAQDEDIWSQITKSAVTQCEREPVLQVYLDDAILRHGSLSQALAHRISQKIADKLDHQPQLYGAFVEILSSRCLEAIVADIEATKTRDAACPGYLEAFLYYKGFIALQAYRVAHALRKEGQTGLASFIHFRASEIWGIDIHPAARIGKGIFIDHGTGIVIGETAVVGDCVSLLHGVTLGGTGKEHGDRHPKVGSSVLIGAGATLLGNIVIGEGARIGAGSVVLASVPAFSTAVGVPAKISQQPRSLIPALDMDHSSWVI